jgi:hypothetical protein
MHFLLTEIKAEKALVCKCGTLRIDCAVYVTCRLEGNVKIKLIVGGGGVL